MNLKDIAPRPWAFPATSTSSRLFKSWRNRTPTTLRQKKPPYLPKQRPRRCLPAAGRPPVLLSLRAKTAPPVWFCRFARQARKSLMQFICMRLYFTGIFPQLFSARAAAHPPGCRCATQAHPNAPQARQAARAGGSEDIPLSFKKRPVLFRRSAAVVRFEQAGNVTPNGQGIAVPAARGCAGPLVDAHGPGERVLLELVSGWKGDIAAGCPQAFTRCSCPKAPPARPAGWPRSGCAGRNAAAGRLRLQHRLGLRAQEASAPPRCRLHHDARQAVFYNISYCSRARCGPVR